MALAACEDTEAALRRGAPQAIVLSEVVLETYGQEGRTSVVHSPEVTYRRDTGELHGADVVADLPPSVGRGGARLAAPQARGDVKKRAAVAEGGVTAASGEGDRARTAAATYDGAAGTVSGDTAVRVEGPGYTLDAGGYVFHVEENRLELTGGVAAKTQPHAGEAR